MDVEREASTKKTAEKREDGGTEEVRWGRGGENDLYSENSKRRGLTAYVSPSDDALAHPHGKCVWVSGLCDLLG